MAKKKTPIYKGRPRRPGKGVLLPHEEAFCQGICDGMSAGQSYRHHVGKGKITMGHAYSRASEWMRRQEIKVRIEALRRDWTIVSEQVLGVKRENVLRRLWEIVDTPVGEVDQKSHLASKVTLNREGRTIEMPSKTEALRMYIDVAGFKTADSLSISLVKSEDVNRAVAALFRKKPIQTAKPK